MATNCSYEFQKKHFGFHDVTAEDYYVSQWFDNKLVYDIYRAVILVYWAVWTIYGTIEYSSLPGGEYYYVFLSHWGEWVLVVHYGLSLGVAMFPHVMKCSKGSLSGRGKPRWFHNLRWIVRTVAFPSSYLVTIIFWSVPAVTTRGSMAVNINRHVFNVVLITLDLFMDRLPVRLLHFIYPVLYGLTYTIFTLILHWANVKSKFYSVILDWETIPGRSVGVTLGVTFLAGPLIHVLSFGLYHLKALIARRCGCQGKMTTQVEGRVNPTLEMEDIE